MNAAKFKTEQTILRKPIVGDDNRFHYIYKMINTINGKYYIGLHSTKDLNDGYCGSGQALMKAYKKHGYEPFVKLVLSFHNNMIELEQAEAGIVTEEVINDPNCYNINCGGGHHPVRTVTCRDIVEGKNVRIPQEEYYAHPERYVSQTKGQIKATDESGKIFMANIDDPRFKTGEIWDYVKQFLKNTFPARMVATGQNIRVHKDDPRLLTGEVVHIQKGRIKVMKGNEIRAIEKKYLQSYLDSGWELGCGLKGIKRGPSKCIGRCHVWRGTDVLVIQKSDLDKYLADGWKRGNGPTTTLIYNDSECRRIPLSDLDKYLADGWKRGNPCKSVAGKISIHKGSQRKFINPVDLGQYIMDGWSRGFKSL